MIPDRLEAHASILMRVATGHQDFPAGLANGGGDVGVTEADALGGESIEVGRDILDRGAESTDGVPVHVVRCDEKEVHTAK